MHNPQKWTQKTCLGKDVTVRWSDENWLEVEHDGSITWDELFAIKCEIWGDEAVALEVYPPRSQLVNNAVCRHLWRVDPESDWPNMTDYF